MQHRQERQGTNLWLVECSARARSSATEAYWYVVFKETHVNRSYPRTINYRHVVLSNTGCCGAHSKMVRSLAWRVAGSLPRRLGLHFILVLILTSRLIDTPTVGCIDEAIESS